MGGVASWSRERKRPLARLLIHLLVRIKLWLAVPPLLLPRVPARRFAVGSRKARGSVGLGVAGDGTGRGQVNRDEAQRARASERARGDAGMQRASGVARVGDVGVAGVADVAGAGVVADAAGGKERKRRGWPGVDYRMAAVAVQESQSCAGWGTAVAGRKGLAPVGECCSRSLRRRCRRQRRVERARDS